MAHQVLLELQVPVVWLEQVDLLVPQARQG